MLTKSAVSASAASTVLRAPPMSPRHSASAALRWAAATFTASDAPSTTWSTSSAFRRMMELNSSTLNPGAYVLHELGVHFSPEPATLGQHSGKLNLIGQLSYLVRL